MTMDRLLTGAGRATALLAALVLADNVCTLPGTD